MEECGLLTTLQEEEQECSPELLTHSREGELPGQGLAQVLSQMRALQQDTDPGGPC